MKLLSFTSAKNNGGNFTTQLSPTLRLKANKEYEVALLSATICRGWPTISNNLANNKIQYRLNGTDTWKTITFPDGNYTLDLLNVYMKNTMKAAGHYNAGADTSQTATNDDIYYIILGANIATGRVKITTANSYQLNLNPTIDDKVYRMNIDFGFSPATALITTNGEHYGDSVPDLNRGINQLHIRTDIVSASGSYVNGKPGKVLYTLAPNGPAYSLMTITPTTLIFLPLNSDSISSVQFSLTEQNGNELTTGDETTSITVVIRQAD